VNQEVDSTRFFTDVFSLLRDSCIKKRHLSAKAAFATSHCAAITYAFLATVTKNIIATFARLPMLIANDVGDALRFRMSLLEENVFDHASSIVIIMKMTARFINLLR
jgi:hypothetical protein